MLPEYSLYRNIMKSYYGLMPSHDLRPSSVNNEIEHLRLWAKQFKNEHCTNTSIKCN